MGCADCGGTLRACPCGTGYVCADESCPNSETKVHGRRYRPARLGELKGGGGKP